MGLIGNLLQKLKEKRERKKQFEEEQRLIENFEIRKLNSNERELLKFQEEERQKKIKEALENFRKKRQQEIWSGKIGNPLYTDNVIKGQKNLFKNERNLFAAKRGGRKNLGGNLFFK